MTSPARVSTLPSPRFPDPRDAPCLRWGMMAPGWIASNFARALRSHTDQAIVAVGSRSLPRAAAFAASFEIDRAYGSYAELLADDDVDVVYVASPHSEHREQALAVIAAGKHVLVEKAFTRNASEAREVVAAARAAGVFLMEAMWSRYLPHTDVVRQLLDDGALGEVRLVTADFGSRSDPAPGHRLLAPALAGGVLLDIGIYPLAFASFVFRHAGLAWPTNAAPSLQVAGSLAITGVDAEVAVQLNVPGAHAQLFTTMYAETPQTAVISGSAGRIEYGPRFFGPAPVTLVSAGERVTWDDNTIMGLDGLSFQAAALARHVADGARESSLEPLDETIAILETADAIRARLGVVYPGEQGVR